MGWIGLGLITGWHGTVNGLPLYGPLAAAAQAEQSAVGREESITLPHVIPGTRPGMTRKGYRAPIVKPAILKVARRREGLVRRRACLPFFGLRSASVSLRPWAHQLVAGFRVDGRDRALDLDPGYAPLYGI